MLATAGAMAGGISGFVGNPGGKIKAWMTVSLLFTNSISEIIMVRLQGDAAKPPAQRYNYKNCFDALFSVSTMPDNYPAYPMLILVT